MPSALNLLSDPLLAVRTRGEQRGLTLPEVLAALGRDEIESFSALQPHQRQAWFSFLVQLAAMALDEDEGPVQSAERWAELLRSMTQEHGDAAWSLVVDEVSKPAFFQPPVPEGSLEEFKPVPSPDDLDVLITSKNHDVKALRQVHPKPEHWVYALCTLQTMQGFLGPGNYGIARMNGGFASRPSVSLNPDHRWGSRFVRDVSVLRERKDRGGEHIDYPATGGHQLLWLLPWDGATQLSPSACDRYFIEVCRRVRLASVEGVVAAFSKGTKSARIDPGELAGNLGDPWTPVDVKGSKALTVPAGGFTYQRLQELAFGGDYRRGIAQEPFHADPAAMELLATVLVRGQGKTEGLHERRVPIPKRIVTILASTEGRERLARMAKARVDRASEAQDVLKRALHCLFQARTDKLDFKDKRPQRWLDRLDAAIDRIFFEELFADAELSFDEAEARWCSELRKLARAELDHAEEQGPVRDHLRYRGIAAAERTFNFEAKKHLGHAPAEVAHERSESP